jgi:uncharacterized membrane protein
MTTGNRMRWLLIASLALNLFLGGLFAGQWLSDGDDGPWHRGPSVRLHFGTMLESLSPETRAMARQVVERHRPATRAAFQKLRQARAEVGAALAAEPFKPEALDAAFTAYREASAAAHLQLQRTMAEVAAKLPPEARKTMAENMSRLAERRHRPPPPRD